MSEMDLHVLRESVDLLILKALTWGPRHGYAIAEWIESATNATLLIEEGTLYPALHRLARRRFVRTQWGASENNRKAKFYELTAAGRRQLAAEREAWERFSAALGLILDAG